MKYTHFTASSAMAALMMTQTAFAAGPEDLFNSTMDFMTGWTPKILQVLSVGDAKNGQALAKEHRCAKCHGKEGISDEDDTPSLAGQTAAYVFKQLSDYKSGSRDDRSMKKATRKLGAKDMADLGVFYETLKAEKKLGGEVPPLVYKGDRSRLLIACSDCHNESAGFRKMMEIPATLEGQKPEYFLDTLTAFREGDRTNDLFGRMQFIASRLTEEEIEALSKYYSVMPLEE